MMKIGFASAILYINIKDAMEIKCMEEISKAKIYLFLQLPYSTHSSCDMFIYNFLWLSTCEKTFHRHTRLTRKFILPQVGTNVFKTTSC